MARQACADLHPAVEPLQLKTFSVLPSVIKCWTPDAKARNPPQCMCWPQLVFHIAPFVCPVFNSEKAPVLPLLLITEQKSLWHDMCQQLPVEQQWFIQNLSDLSRCFIVTAITTTNYKMKPTERKKIEDKNESKSSFETKQAHTSLQVNCRQMSKCKPNFTTGRYHTWGTIHRGHANIAAA